MKRASNQEHCNTIHRALTSYTVFLPAVSYCLYIIWL